ncbi:sensor histidine kinase [Streptomyces sp. NBC_01465]|uniref:sensor histidine kinase n=1 Tax=Streptomyces sp. NBC_01465 TaxID=2903878 RepID=UPI002E2F9A86|nr:ATP-binding protein [Streptomyces sp. NBC_01465]
MVRVEAPPTDRTLPLVRALLLSVVLTSAATAAGVIAVTEPARIPLVWAGAAATVVVAGLVAEIIRRAGVARHLHHSYGQRLAFLERRLAAHDAETVRLAKELMPAAVHRLKHGESPEEVMRVLVDNNDTYRDLPPAQREILHSLLRIVDDEEAQREGSQHAFVGIARRVQSIVRQQATELRDMEDEHGRQPEVFDDLLRIDHGNALIGRLADSISVLGGARPGRQWPNPVPLFSVLRGAMSRILEYPRVDLHSIAKVAIVGPSVEPLIHACAELLDNATRYSPPQTRVHVTAVEVQTGIAIEIEDGGVSLSEESRRRAEGMITRAQAGGGLNDLSDSPRLGLAVVGRICQKYNFKIALRQSAYGGVRAVLIVPREVITSGPAPGIAHGIGATAIANAAPGPDPLEGRNHGRKKPRKPAGPQRTTLPAPVSLPASLSMEDDVPVVTEWTPNGLPQRRSRLRTPLPAEVPQAPAEPFIPQPYTPEPYTPEQPQGHDEFDEYDEKKTEDEPGPGIWLDAFTKAVNGVPQDPSEGDPK